MNHALLDQQFENLFSRALRDPYFDLEQALCVVMESWMQQRESIEDVFTSPAKGRQGGVSSIVRIFAWPSEELCACLHKCENDQVYLFRAIEKKLLRIESSEPMLRPIDSGDRILVLNDVASQVLDSSTIELLLYSSHDVSDGDLMRELHLRAEVNARGNMTVSSDLFGIFSCRA